MSSFPFSYSFFCNGHLVDHSYDCVINSLLSCCIYHLNIYVSCLCKNSCKWFLGSNTFNLYLYIQALLPGQSDFGKSWRISHKLATLIHRDILFFLNLNILQSSMVICLLCTSSNTDQELEVHWSYVHGDLIVLPFDHFDVVREVKARW